jgi:cytoskeletal protein CcmA (bactofilin family)
MRGTWRSRAAAVLAAAAALGCAALAATATEMRAGDEVNVTGAFDQLLFAAGDKVRMAVTATDDVAAAGGDVQIDGSTVDHIFLAGGELAFLNSTARDLFAAGGEIDLTTGDVSDDVVVAGGRITLGPQARIGGDAVVSGGRLRIETPIGGDLRAAGGRIALASTVVGDVFLDAGSITIEPGAHIRGSLTYRGRRVSISPQAQVDGQTIVLRPRPEVNLAPLAMFATWMAAAILFGLFLMAVVIAAAFPRLMNDAAEAIRKRPLSMLGLGLALAVLTPIAIALLIATILGIPLAFVLGAMFALLWPLAIVGAVYALAMLARGRLRPDAAAPSAGARALWAGLAMIVFILLGLIPVIGFFIWLGAYLIGLGAVAWRAAEALAKPAVA